MTYKDWLFIGSVIAGVVLVLAFVITQISAINKACTDKGGVLVKPQVCIKRDAVL